LRSRRSRGRGRLPAPRRQRPADAARRCARPYRCPSPHPRRGGPARPPRRHGPARGTHHLRLAHHRPPDCGHLPAASRHCPRLKLGRRPSCTGALPLPRSPASAVAKSCRAKLAASPKVLALCPLLFLFRRTSMMWLSPAVARLLRWLRPVGSACCSQYSRARYPTPPALRWLAKPTRA
nr:hypothetical protein [Tanacetum cinerariifolium]